MAATNQFKTSWDAFDKIFDEAFSRTKSTANRPPYFSPTPFTPYPPTEYQYEPTFTYPGYSGRNSGHGEDEDFHPPDYHAEPDEDEPCGFHDDDFYSRADIEYYEDDDYEKAFWTKRARRAHASGNSGIRKTDALELTGVNSGFGNDANTGLGLTTGGTTFSQSHSQPTVVPQRPQPSTLSQTIQQSRPMVTTNVNPPLNNSSTTTTGAGAGVSSTSNPLSNAMSAFSAAAAALNGLTNSLNGLGLGPNATSTIGGGYPNPSAPSAPRAAAPIVPHVPILSQPRPPIRKPPPPLNIEDSSSGSGSASSSSLDPASPFKLSPGSSPPAPPAPSAPAQFQPQFQPQLQSQFQFQQYPFQPENQFPTTRSMLLQQQQQQAQSQQKNQNQATTVPGQKQGQEQGKAESRKAQTPAPAPAQTQPIPMPTISKASVQAANQESQSRSLDRSMGMGIALMSPPIKPGAMDSLSTSPKPGSVERDNMKSPTPSSSTIHKKRRPNPGKVTFRDSADGTCTTATFDMQGIKKSDIHVSYQNDKVVVSWETVTVEDKLEDGKIVRERREKKYIRTLPLGDGTKFAQVKASMDGRYLNLTYPKFR